MIKDFHKYQAQTSPYPLGMEVSHAKGAYIYDTSGKKYLDFVAGVSACTLGHQHPRVTNAIKDQLDKYAHVMVYGEYAQDPAVALCKLLAANMPEQLNKTYLVNSGTEATEGALKLARRVTGRSQLISCFNAYHGNTMGSMSVMGFEERKQVFRPLIPDVDFITFNNEEDLQKITTKTAGIILETIQGGAGFIQPYDGFLKKVRERCDEVGAMMILDEIQPGFGRTGKLFGFQNYDIVPDIVVMGKGMGGGMPVGAFTANEKHMDLLSHDPKLGHITTFGGHPLITASAAAFLDVLSTEIDFDEVERLGALLEKIIASDHEIKEVRRAGMMFAFDMESFERVERVVKRCLEYGVISFWFLSHTYSFRLSPPINITEAEIVKAGEIILRSIAETRQ